MSLCDKIRSIVLGGALLFSGFAGALYAQDTFPGGVGEKGLQQSSENYQKEQAAKAKKAKEDEERRKQEEERRKREEAMQAKTPDYGDGGLPSPESDEEDEDDKSLECKIASFALINNSASVFLKATADSTDLATRIDMSGFKTGEEIAIGTEMNIGCNYLNRGVAFSNASQDIDLGFLESGGAFTIAAGPKLIGDREGKDAPYGVYAGLNASVEVNFYDTYFTNNQKGHCGVFSTLNMRGFQLLTDLNFIGENINNYESMFKDGYESIILLGGLLNCKAYLPIQITDTEFLFLKPEFKYKNANVKVTAVSGSQDYALHGYLQELIFSLCTGFVFDLTKGAFLSIGPEFQSKYLIVKRETFPYEQGLPKKILKYTAGVCATLTSDWFSASLGLGYDWKTFDFYGGERVKKDGIYLMLELKANFGLGGKKEEDTVTK